MAATVTRLNPVSVISEGQGGGSESKTGGLGVSCPGAVPDRGDAPQVRVERLAAVFVVHFDTRHGNDVEWLRAAEGAEGALADGLEYKSMPSGVHSVRSDYVYFRHGPLFGLAVFNNREVVTDRERGARMRSVGVLSKTYETLHQHMQFLQEAVVVCNGGDAVELSVESKVKLEGYMTKVNVAATTGHIPRDMPGADNFFHPAQLARPLGMLYTRYGSGMFTILWKAMMLKLRILFFSPVPVGVVCDRVHASCGLVEHNLDPSAVRLEPSPLFFVNVVDIDALSTSRSYVACTSEKIFSEKQALYDVYVDNDKIVASPTFRKLLAITAGDKQRFEEYTKKVQRGGRSGGDGAPKKQRRGSGAGPPPATRDARRSEFKAARRRSRELLRHLSSSNTTDTALRALFAEGNSTLIGTIIDCVGKGAIMPEDLDAMAIHDSDVPFLQELLNVHGWSTSIAARPRGCC